MNSTDTIFSDIRKAPGFVGSLVAFLILAEKTLRTRLAYRASTMISMLTSAMAYGVFLLVWMEVYRANPGADFMPKTVLLPYLVIAFVLNFALTLQVEFRFMLRLRQGLVATDLIRPVNFVVYQSGQGLGDLVGNALMVLPVFGMGWWFLGSALAPASLSSVALAAVSVAMAFLIQFGISYILMQVGFVTMSMYGIFFTRMALHQVFSGLAAPLAMFPAALGTVANWLPFRHVIETPVLIWMGQVDTTRALSLMAQQAVWSLGLLCTGLLMFNIFVGRHQVQGG